MNFIIKSTNINLDSKLRDYIKERISSCDKYINTDFPITARIEIERTTDHHIKGKIFRAEVNLKLKNKFLRAEATREDIHLAINEMRDNLKTELKKNKEITTEKKHRSYKSHL